MVKSELDKIKGIGTARKKSLLKAFGSVKKLKEADVEEIARVDGIGYKIAESIKSQLK